MARQRIGTQARLPRRAQRRSLGLRPELMRLESRRLLALITVSSDRDENARNDVLTLREAILVSNGNLAITSLTTLEQIQVNGPLAGPGQRNTIAFAIPGDGPHTIAPAMVLPKVSQPVLIDGYSQPGATEATAGSPAVLMIELTGIKLGPGADGLTIEAGQSIIRGLAINGFFPNPNDLTNGFGIILSQEGFNHVIGNYLGTDTTGFIARGNGSGVLILSPDNTIGGRNPSDRNVLSASTFNGIQLSHTNTVAIPSNATRNLIVGNYIGTNSSGSSALGNDDGIRPSEKDATGNIIAGNVLSGNRHHGYFGDWDSGGSDVIQANFIGTDPTGTMPVPNGLEGVELDSPNNTIGGTSAAEANVISGNLRAGILINSPRAQNNLVAGNWIGSDEGGLKPLPNLLDGVEIQNAANNRIEDNQISGNLRNGIAITGVGATGNRIEGNQIGTDSTGLRPMGNGQGGLVIQDAPANLVGGTRPNVITANIIVGVYIGGSTATGNQIGGNRIGTDLAGHLTFGTQLDGVKIEGAPGNIIGGSSPGTENVISGHLRDGVLIRGPGASANQVAGNRIGTNLDGLLPLPNRGEGVLIENAPGNLIGGSTQAETNVISGNGGDGIQIQGTDATANVLMRNLIGVDITGNIVLPNGNDGVAIKNAPANVIGQVGAGGNVISGNSRDGIRIEGASSVQNRVSRNFIGTNLAGDTPRGNGKIGVHVIEAFLNTIGGSTGGEGNLISDNAASGITIDQGGQNLVESNGIGTDVSRTQQLGQQFGGITISDSTGNTIRGNVVAGHVGEGVLLDNATLTTIQKNLVGVQKDGMTAVPNGVGLRLINSSNNLIGGDPASNGPNVISGNTGDGIRVEGLSATGNRFEGNLIGSDAGLSRVVGNGGCGIEIEDAPGNIIGTPGLGNLIMGNTLHGVWIKGAHASNTLVQGNFIGSDATGKAAFGNGQIGIYILEAFSCTIGGAAAFAGNLISANEGGGVYLSQGGNHLLQRNHIGTDFDGKQRLGTQYFGVEINDSSGNTIGSPNAGNTIAGNLFEGIALHNSTGTIVQANYIGVQTGGGGPLPNRIGIHLENAPGNLIGGQPSILDANLISGNMGEGILIEGPTSMGNIVEGNLIGTDRTGTQAMGNGGSGVVIRGAAGNLIGRAAGLGNVISANKQHGIWIDGPGSTANLIQRNFIGTNLAGDAPLGNVADGILISGGWANTVGAATPGDGNLISANRGDAGLVVFGGGQNLAVGNALGTDRSRTRSLGGQKVGVMLAGTTSNTIGGMTQAEGNVISGNTDAGILLGPGSPVYNVVEGNLIGVQKDRTSPLPNGVGVLFEDGTNNRIGGSAAGGENTISSNLGAGVWVKAGTANTIRFNSMSANGGLGIDLGLAGVTPNDEGDADTGANMLQNAPVLHDALIDGQGNLTLLAELGSQPNQTYLLDVYTLNNPDPSGYGEGSLMVVTSGVALGSSGVRVLTMTLPVTLPLSSYVTGTVTDGFGNTSEFSTWIEVKLDSDGDGVPDDQESIGPNGGDGNRDGIPDSGQPNVVSLPNPVSGDFVTLVAPPGVTLTNVSASYPDTTPDGLSFPLGLFSFAARGMGLGGSLTLDVLLPQGVRVDGWDKFGITQSDPTPHFYDITYDGVTGAEILPDRVRLHFIDGQRGDSDLYTNGIIVDPGGPTIHQKADLVLASTASANLAAIGQELTYTFTVANHGTDDAPDVTFVDTLPDAFSLMDDDVSQGFITETGQTVTAQLFTIAAGESVTITIVVIPTSNGGFTHTATASSSLPALDPSQTVLTVATLVGTTSALVVNTTADHDDGVLDATDTTLREAIRFSNQFGSLDTIVFDIPGEGVHTIRPTSSLPPITDPVILDATTQPGYAGTPLIELDGSLVTHMAVGIDIPAGSSVVRGLAINRFRFDGLYRGSNIVLQGGQGGNLIESCFIGTDPTGSISYLDSLPGLEQGIDIFDSPGNTIGGTAPGAGNLISGNSISGIFIESNYDNPHASANNIIVGNLIGTDRSGSRPLPNGEGVIIHNTADTTIGGTAPGSRNVISGNNGPGIAIDASSAPANGNVIQGNFIGVDASGTIALANSGSGIRLFGAAETIIGGVGEGAGNVISGNTGEGVEINSEGDILGRCSNNMIQGNWIGTDLGGRAQLGNAGDGIWISRYSDTTMIGGTVTGAGNTIAFNGDDGVSVNGSRNSILGNSIHDNGYDGVVVYRGTRNSILGNAIHDNASLGIDLGGGPTANDEGDRDVGPNMLQNYPELVVVNRSGGSTTIEGTLDSLPGKTYRIEFFANSVPDPSGFGEGEYFLGALDVRIDNTGPAAFTFDVPVPVPTGWFITSTATDPDQNTSEFSTSFVVPAPSPPLNSPPIAIPDTATTPEGISVVVPVLANDSDPDGDPLAVSGFDPAGLHGIVTDLGGGLLAYQPAAGFRGIDSFTYRIADGQGGDVGATVTVTVTPVNQPPVANPDAATTLQDRAVTIDVTANDTDPDGNLDTTSVALLFTPSHGSATIDPANGLITYAPASGFVGSDMFSYRVADSLGFEAATSVAVTVVSTNAPPVANPDTATTPRDMAVVIDVAHNDTDTDGDLDTTTVRVTTYPSHGLTVINPNTGTISYTPRSGFAGSDSFTYQICDRVGNCASAAVTIAVTATNRPPVALDDGASTAGQAVTLPLLANDTDPDGNLVPGSITIVAPPIGGTLAVDPASGSVTYSPRVDFSGLDLFVYQIADTAGATGRAEGAVTVTAPLQNRPPVASADTATTTEGTRVTIAVLANDTDPDGDPLTITATDTTGSHGSVAILPDGMLAYTPQAGFQGQDTFRYTIANGRGGQASASVTVTVTLVPVNRPPVVSNDTYVVDAGKTLNLNAPGVLANDRDPERQTITAALARGPAHGLLDLRPSGAFRYTPKPGFVGTDTFTYRASDGIANSSPATVTITVRPKQPSGPHLIKTQRFGFGNQPTKLVLTFDTALDTKRAINPANYRLLAPGPDGRFGTRDDSCLKICAVRYNAIAHKVTLFPSRQLPLNGRFLLSINGTSPCGLADVAGHRLDGNNDGKPGGNALALIDRSSLAGPNYVSPVHCHFHCQCHPSRHR